MSAFPAPRDSGVVLREGWGIVSPFKGFIWMPAQPQKVFVTSEQPCLFFSFAFLLSYINEVGGRFLLHRILRFKKAKQSKPRLFNGCYTICILHRKYIWKRRSKNRIIPQWTGVKSERSIQDLYFITILSPWKQKCQPGPQMKTYNKTVIGSVLEKEVQQRTFSDFILIMQIVIRRQCLPKKTKCHLWRDCMHKAITRSPRRERDFVMRAKCHAGFKKYLFKHYNC